MIHLVLRPRARRDLANIWLYTADKWGTDQADAYVASINAEMKRILAFPQSGSRVVGLPNDYRKIRAGSHRAIYRWTDEKLIVVRIVHAREDVADDWTNE